MSIVYQTNKKNGVVYVYDATSEWSRELKRPVSKRKYLGRRAPDGTIIPPSRRNKKDAAKTADMEVSKTDKVKLEKLLDDKESKISALNTEIGSLNTEIGSLKSKVSELESVISQIQDFVLNVKPK